MHEIGIARQIVEVATRAATGAGLTRVRRMHLELGPDAGLSSAALGLAIEVVSIGTIVEGADTTFERSDDDVEAPAHGQDEATPVDAVRLSWIDGE